MDENQEFLNCNFNFYIATCYNFNTNSSNFVISIVMNYHYLNKNNW